MIAAYLRVSTDRQDHESQRHAITTYLKGQGYALDQVRWYEDTMTGSRIDRPDFERLQKDIFMGTVKQVVIFKLDRIARSIKDGIVVLSDWIEKGVKVVSITEQLDLSGPMGKMLAAVLFGLAEIERNNIRERIKAGMEVAKAAGKCKGRKPGTFKGDHERAKELKAKGIKVPEIARYLDVSIPTVWRYLRIPSCIENN